MSRTSVIFGALVIGFIVFITTKGELPKYLALFTGKGATPVSPVSGGMIGGSA